MNTKEFEYWCNDMYEKFLKDTNIKVVSNEETEMLIVDIKNKKLYTHTNIKNLNISSGNLALAYAEVKNYEIPKIVDNSASARVDKGEHYYCIYQSTDSDPFYSVEHIEYNKAIDNKRYDSNNYFRSSERAERTIGKIYFLLRLERLHSIYCPDYEPDWTDAKDKYCVSYNHKSHKFYLRVVSCETKTDIYFPTEEIAQKVCDELNGEVVE